MVRPERQEAVLNLLKEMRGLNLTQGERDAVYKAVINLVSQRLNKARSV